MIRMLIVGYCLGIRSERRLCDEVHLNLAYRWFCRLGLDGDVPDHSTFSKNRHGRFRESDLLRKLFETIFRSGLWTKLGVHWQFRWLRVVVGTISPDAQFSLLAWRHLTALARATVRPTKIDTQSLARETAWDCCRAKRTQRWRQRGK
jgi:IS5 family transposase